MTAEIEALLKQRLGLDAESIGSATIARAVQERLSASRINDVAAYADLLRLSNEEWQELIERVIVAETWFFRDAQAFATMTQYASEEWLPSHPGDTLRLLSLPCSTGEEAYSMAMALLNTGMSSDRFSIDAIDVSLRSLQRAEEAFYGKNSFRSTDLDFRDRYLKPSRDGYQLAEALVQQVHFKSGNVLEETLLPEPETYDVIFCRNLLIYFDQSAQERTVKTLWRLLKPDGLVFVGPSETSLLASHGFISLKAPLSFAFRKMGAVVEERKSSQPLPPPTRVRAALPPFTQARPLPDKQPAPVASIDLDEAQHLADEGRWAEAIQRCEEYNRAHGPSSRAFCLLGLVHDAAGKPLEAIRFYRKALYLDPQHRESLQHLALLLDRQGDHSAATILNERAARLEIRIQN